MIGARHRARWSRTSLVERRRRERTRGAPRGPPPGDHRAVRGAGDRARPERPDGAAAAVLRDRGPATGRCSGWSPSRRCSPALVVAGPDRRLPAARVSPRTLVGGGAARPRGRATSSSPDHRARPPGYLGFIVPLLADRRRLRGRHDRAHGDHLRQRAARPAGDRRRAQRGLDRGRHPDRDPPGRRRSSPAGGPVRARTASRPGSPAEAAAACGRSSRIPVRVSGRRRSPTLAGAVHPGDAAGFVAAYVAGVRTRAHRSAGSPPSSAGWSSLGLGHRSPGGAARSDGVDLRAPRRARADRPEPRRHPRPDAAVTGPRRGSRRHMGHGRVIR